VVYAGLTDAGLVAAERGALAYAAALREYLLPAIPAEKLVEFGRLMRSLDPLVSDATEAPDEAEVEDLPAQRDPALPDRRRRGRD
jgi:hypothetical protein